MEVIEDGNIMDRIPILLQRDLEYYQVCTYLPVLKLMAWFYISLYYTIRLDSKGRLLL